MKVLDKMGKCRNCGENTVYPHNNGWCSKCFFFNTQKPRLYLSALITFIILQLPLIDEIGLRVLLMKALYDVTAWQPFLLASILIYILIIATTYFGISLSIYKIFKKFNIILE